MDSTASIVDIAQNIMSLSLLVILAHVWGLKESAEKKNEILTKKLLEAESTMQQHRLEIIHLKSQVDYLTTPVAEVIQCP